MSIRRPPVPAPAFGVIAGLGRSPRARLAAVLFGLATLGFGGCAQNPQQIAAASHGKEYFPSSIYGAASRRVIADGQPIPRGGGQYLVGRPYTVAGQTYYPSERRIVQVGNASWYGDAFHGRLTANGEIYDRDGFTAAHPTMPLPSYARVTNLRNNYSMIVRVNDRGPYASNRIMDVSRRVAEALDFKRYGTARIKVEYVGRASLAGSDDAKLYATLRTERPASWPQTPTMVAEAQPVRRVASLSPDTPAPRPRWSDAGDEGEAAPPRRRETAAVAGPPPDWRRMERPAAVEAAYRRFGAEREAAPPPARPRARYVETGEDDRMDGRFASARRHDEDRLALLAAAEPMPRPGYRSAPARVRYDEGDIAPVRSTRAFERVLVPPIRPQAFGTVRDAVSPYGTHRRLADLRQRDD